MVLLILSQHYNHLRQTQKEKDEADYKRFVESHSVDEIEAANKARARLRRHYSGDQQQAKKWQPIKDERAVKKPSSAYILFSRSRWASGDFKNITVAEGSKLVGQEWKALAQDEKKVSAGYIATLRRPALANMNAEIRKPLSPGRRTIQRGILQRLRPRARGRPWRPAGAGGSGGVDSQPPSFIVYDSLLQQKWRNGGQREVSARAQEGVPWRMAPRRSVGMGLFAEHCTLMLCSNRHIPFRAISRYPCRSLPVLRSVDQMNAPGVNREQVRDCSQRDSFEQDQPSILCIRAAIVASRLIFPPVLPI